MINRREFGGGLVGIAARGIAGSYVAAEQETSANSFMHVGGDYHGVVGIASLRVDRQRTNLR